MKNLFYLICLAFFVSSCGDDDVPGLTLEEYIAQNNLVTQELDDGTHIVLHEPGSSSKPNINSRVRVNYEGRLTDESVFDANDDIEFNLFGVIEGWKTGFKEIGVGGSATLIIPPSAAYGSSARTGIPANSVLIFDVELLEIVL